MSPSGKPHTPPPRYSLQAHAVSHADAVLSLSLTDLRLDPVAYPAGADSPVWVVVDVLGTGESQTREVAASGNSAVNGCNAVSSLRLDFRGEYACGPGAALRAAFAAALKTEDEEDAEVRWYPHPNSNLHILFVYPQISLPLHILVYIYICIAKGGVGGRAED